MKKFNLIHDYKYGIAIYPLLSTQEITDWVGNVDEKPEVDDITKKIIDALDITFEPWKGDSIEIEGEDLEPLDVDELLGIKKVYRGLSKLEIVENFTDRYNQDENYHALDFAEDIKEALGFK